jgi:hypothetical protein
LGKTDDANKLIKSIFPIETTYIRACAYAVLGEKDNMLKQLTVAVNENQARKVDAKIDPDFTEYQQDPEFLKIVV